MGRCGPVESVFSLATIVVIFAPNIFYHFRNFKDFVGGPFFQMCAQPNGQKSFV